MGYSFMYTFDGEKIFSHYIDSEEKMTMNEVLKEINDTIQKEHKGKLLSNVVGLSVLIK